jgi:oligoendopeptidase F
MLKATAGLVALLLAAPGVMTAAAQTIGPDSSLVAGPPVVWDLRQLYPTDAAWEAERTAIAGAVPALAAYKGELGKDAASLATALRSISDLRRRLGRLETYAGLKRDEDTRVSQNQDRLDRATLLDSAFAKAVSYVDPEIIHLGAARIDKFIAADAALKPFAFQLRDALRRAPHTLGDEAESVLAASGTMAQAPQTIYTMLANADIPWPTVTLSDGRSVRIDSQGYTATRDLPDREDRRKVFDAFYAQWAQYRNSFGATLGADIQGTVFQARARHYPNSLAYALARTNLPEAVYRTLVAEADRGLPSLYRYFTLRKTMLGLPDLHYYDLYVPLVKSDRKYSVADAERMTLDAVAPLGPDYVATLRKDFAAGWMHALPQPGKKPGAYMNAGAYDAHPYVLANFTGNYDSVSTIAHEWGHAMHSVLADGAQPFETSEYPTFLAEIASITNEMLLQDRQIALATTREDKLFFLNQALETIRGTFFRQTMFAEFELQAHEAAERGEALTGDALTRIYLALLKRYHGDAQGVVRIDDAYGLEWAYIPHFYDDFYVYQYAASVAAAAYFSHAIGGGDTKTRDVYLGVLKSGGSDYPYDVLKRAGLDMASPAPYRAVIARMDGILDRMEALNKR